MLSQIGRDNNYPNSSGFRGRADGQKAGLDAGLWGRGVAYAIRTATLQCKHVISILLAPAQVLQFCCQVSFGKHGLGSSVDNHFPQDAQLSTMLPGNRRAWRRSFCLIYYHRNMLASSTKGIATSSKNATSSQGITTSSKDASRLEAIPYRNMFGWRGDEVVRGQFRRE